LSRLGRFFYTQSKSSSEGSKSVEAHRKTPDRITPAPSPRIQSPVKGENGKLPLLFQAGPAATRRRIGQQAPGTKIQARAADNNFLKTQFGRSILHRGAGLQGSRMFSRNFRKLSRRRFSAGPLARVPSQKIEGLGDTRLTGQSKRPGAGRRTGIGGPHAPGGHLKRPREFPGD